MVFEATFEIVVAPVSIFSHMYIKIRGKSSGLFRQNYQPSAELRAVKEQLHNMVKALSVDAFKEQNDSFKIPTVDLLNKMVDNLKTKMEDLGRQNVGDREVFEAGIKRMADTIDELEKGHVLSSVLWRSQNQGCQAEINVECIFVMIVLMKGNYYTQCNKDTKKLDFVVELPVNCSIIIDSNTPLAAPWRATDTGDEATEAEVLSKHANAIKDRIRLLPNKEYVEGANTSFDFVVMVMSECALLPALKRDGNCVKCVMEICVVLAMPSTLMIFLRLVGLVWKQNEITKVVQDIGCLAQRRILCICLADFQFCVAFYAWLLLRKPNAVCQVPHVILTSMSQRYECLQHSYLIIHIKEVKKLR